MQKSFDIPVLLLFFNRPAHAASVIAGLRAVRPSSIYVHIDGPRTDRPAEVAAVQAVRTTIESIDWKCTIKQLIRDENYGLRRGVKGAIDWFFEHESMGIILEDDCQPDASFFPFCEKVLVEYADSEQVMHIAANNLTEERTENLSESFVFSTFPFVWGWASWRRAWQKMDIDMEGLAAFAESASFQTMLPDAQARNYLLDKFQTTKEKRNQSWAYAWFFSILKNEGLCIVPKVNLSQNTGIGDANATHTQGKNDKAARPARSIDFPLIFPEKIAVRPDLEQQFFYDSQKAKHRLPIWYWKKCFLDLFS